MRASPACRIVLRLSMDGAGARAVREALGPDNVGFPEGLSMSVSEEAPGLVLRLEGAGLLQLASTADEVLGHVQAALGAIGRC